MSKELRTPPSEPVFWTITRRDGTVGRAQHRTAFAACTDVLKWSFQDCIDFQEESPHEQH